MQGDLRLKFGHTTSEKSVAFLVEEWMERYPSMRLGGDGVWLGDFNAPWDYYLRLSNGLHCVSWTDSGGARNRRCYVKVEEAMEDDKIESGKIPAENAKPADVSTEKKIEEPAPAPRHFVLKVESADFEVVFGTI